MRAAIRTNWLFAALLTLGALVRLATMIAYPPGLFFGDSWGYLSAAYARGFVSLPSLRPIGYSLLIRLLAQPGRSILTLVAIQHLSGLLAGTLVYLALRRARVARALAAGAAALVLLDGYAITLEQYVMADSFYTLTLLVAVLVLAWPGLAAGRPGFAALALRSPSRSSRTAPRTPARAAALTALSGLLVALSAIERQAGVWVVPTFVVYLLWTRAPRARLAAFLVALALPLAAYASLVKADFGVFGLTATSGRTLYSRVAGFADCQGVRLPADERILCETPAQRRSHPTAPDWYMFAAASPAQRDYNVARETATQQARANAILGRFAKRVILHQPLSYAGSVLADFLDFLRPGATAYNDAVSATSLPRTVASETIDEPVRRRLIPGTHPSVRAPAGLVRWYRGVVHVPRPLLAALAILAVLALAKRASARREILLTAGSGLLLLLGTAASGGFGLRYLLPAVPLLAIGGALAARDLNPAHGGAGSPPDQPPAEIVTVPVNYS